MKSSTRITLFAAAAIALTQAVNASTAYANEVTLRLHQFLPAQAHMPKNVLDVWIENVQRDSEGRIRIDHFPSMQLGGSPAELIDQVADGVADIIWTVIGYTPGRYPRTEVFELPFLAPDGEVASRAFFEMVDTQMRDQEFADIHVLGAWTHDAGLFHTKDPVKEISDLSGMKIRGASRTVTMLLEEFGATPIGMPVPSVPESLSMGVLDGATLPWGVVGGMRVPELVHNHTEFTGNALFTATFLFAMNKSTYDSLSGELKDIIDKNSTIEFSAFAGKSQDQAAVIVRNEAESAGNNIITLSQDETEKWREAAFPVYSRWAADMDSRGFDGRALITEAERLIEKHSNGY